MKKRVFAEVKQGPLKKLYRMGCWGKGHVCESNLQKGFPSHVRGYVLDVAKKLRKEGLLVMRPSGHDRQWYLNTARRGEIEEIIKD